MRAHTYTHLFKVIQPYLLGHDPDRHINNPIVAFSKTCKACGMKREISISTFYGKNGTHCLDCQAMTDARQGAGIDGNRSKNNEADVHFGWVSRPSGIKWMWVCLGASIWCGDAGWRGAVARCWDIKGRVDESAKCLALFFVCFFLKECQVMEVQSCYVSCSMQGRKDH